MAKSSLPNFATRPNFCLVTGCTRSGRLRCGMCELHYRRYKRAGSTDKPTPSRYLSLEERFFSHIADDRPENGCWLWIGNTKNGYGNFVYGKQRLIAHRASYLIHYGYLPDVVRHSCDNPACVNPQHLLAGTQLDNIADAVERKRFRRGSTHPRSHLTEADVTEIKKRLRHGDTAVDIAKDFPISAKGIGSIKSGQTWKHVQ